MHQPITSANVLNLLTELCVELGFSLPLREPSRFLAKVPFGAEAFVDSVLSAEGLNSSTPVREQVLSVVANHFAAWRENGAV